MHTGPFEYLPRRWWRRLVFLREGFWWPRSFLKGQRIGRRKDEDRRSSAWLLACFCRAKHEGEVQNYIKTNCEEHGKRKHLWPNLYIYTRHRRGKTLPPWWQRLLTVSPSSTARSWLLTNWYRTAMRMRWVAEDFVWLGRFESLTHQLTWSLGSGEPDEADLEFGFSVSLPVSHFPQVLDFINMFHEVLDSHTRKYRVAWR